jgi:hypothetical protein
MADAAALDNASGRASAIAAVESTSTDSPMSNAPCFFKAKLPTVIAHLPLPFGNECGRQWFQKSG